MTGEHIACEWVFSPARDISRCLRTAVITEQWMSIWARDMKIANYALATSYEWQVWNWDSNSLWNKKKGNIKHWTYFWASQNKWIHSEHETGRTLLLFFQSDSKQTQKNIFLVLLTLIYKMCVYQLLAYHKKLSSI